MTPALDPRRIIVGVMLVLLLGAMNQTIVAVALPRIAEDLQGYELLAWVISGYLVAATVTTPIYGKLCDRHGVRPVLRLALLLFAVGTLGCALSASMPMLVGFRVLQGIGGGGLISSSHAAISQAVSLRERGRYQGYISSMFALASVLGPVLGGWLTERLSWHWVFAVNLPLALAALAATHRALRPLPLPARDRRRPIDAAGALLLSFGLTALLIAITRAGQGHAWLDARNAAWLAAAAALLAGYAWRDARADDPVLPLPLLRTRIVSLGLLTQFLAHASMVTLTVMVPLELQLVAGLPPAAAAAQLIALSLGVPLGSLVAGRTVARTGRYRLQQTVGAAATAATVFGLAAAVGLGAPHGLALGLLFAAGVGFGLQFPTTLVAIQNASPPEHLGAAIAAINFVRSLGGAIGIAVLSTVLLELVRAGAPELGGGGGGGDVLRALTETSADALRQELRPVATRAFVVIFALCGLASVVVLGIFRAMPERPLRS
jgi:EmrB/QacA subfamily drug resistance transporter